jgi:pyruvate/2-oxoacid:ferredoxin oxidoreductase alpha subunit
MGVKVGLLHITSFRPFPSIEVVEALRHVKAMAVLERLDIPMMQSNPQLVEIKAAFADAASGTPRISGDHQRAKVLRWIRGIGQP